MPDTYKTALLPRALLSLAAATVLQAGAWQPAVAQNTATLSAEAASAPAQTLRQAFEAAWQRRPEARALQLRRDAATANRQSAQRWTAEPAALELLARTDRLNRDRGSREQEFGVALPLWLPGERARTAAVADAQAAGLESQLAASRLDLAAELRAAYWRWHAARIDADVAHAQLANAQMLAADVRKRVAAGDLAKSDQHQADGAVAKAELALEQAASASISAEQELRSVIGASPEALASAQPEPEPAPADAADGRHPRLQQLQARLEVAQRTAELASVQTRANPELTLGSTRERGASGEAYGQTLNVGVRIPFGSDSRSQARTAAALADATEAQAQLALEQERLAAGQEAARARVASARAQLASAERRAALARETRGLFERSFRLGETDLPTRLRIELEAVEAERQAARSRLAVGAAVSSWRQALGLLPD